MGRFDGSREDGVHRRRGVLALFHLADLAARSGIRAGQAWAALIVDGIIVW